MKEILILFALVVLQNASFTLVSRARNSKSLLYHGIASVLSNGIWLLVIRQVVLNLDNVPMMITYLVASVIGSIGMHYIAMEYFEKKKVKEFKKAWTEMKDNPQPLLVLSREINVQPAKLRAQNEVEDYRDAKLEAFTNVETWWQRFKRYWNDYMSGRKWD